VTELYVGTSGYSYKEWKGHFYPEKMPAGEFLGFYAQHLRTVEINNTFYRMPRKEQLQKWCEQVPDHFRFVFKTSRRITHISRLKQSSYEPLKFLTENLEAVGDKLGATLIQLPPTFRAESDRFAEFLNQLPRTQNFAFEFRQKSWFEEPVYQLMRDANVALCVSDSGDGESATPRVSTADWGYLRLRRPQYTNEEMLDWADWIEKQLWTRAFVYFKHEDEGAGPKIARQLLDTWAGLHP
jgi:uncharacterized protein YecE (DUF72 family)